MGLFSVGCLLENQQDRTRSVRVPKVMVYTGSELTWISHRHLEEIGVEPEKKNRRFIMANGQEITRSIGFAIIRVGREIATDQIVFAQDDDLQLLGARTLEGLNVKVDSRNETGCIRSIDCRRQHAIRLSSRRRRAPELHLQNRASASLTQPNPIRSCSRRRFRPIRWSRRSSWSARSSAVSRGRSRWIERSSVPHSDSNASKVQRSIRNDSTCPMRPLRHPPEQGGPPGAGPFHESAKFRQLRLLEDECENIFEGVQPRLVRQRVRAGDAVADLAHREAYVRHGPQRHDLRPDLVEAVAQLRRARPPEHQTPRKRRLSRYAQTACLYLAAAASCSPPSTTCDCGVPHLLHRRGVI